VLFILYVNDMPVPSLHVELTFYGNDTAVIAMSRTSALLIRYLETYLIVLERWLREWRIAINVSKINAMLFAKAPWRISRPRHRRANGMGRYSPILGSDSSFRPDLAASYRTGRKESLPATGCACSLLNRRSGLSIRNGVLLYKQLIRPMMDYACPIWRYAARSYVKQLQALQSEYLRIAIGAPWYISDREIHELLGVLFFEEHTRALTESYDSKLAGAGNPLVRQLGRYLR
jgi:hypothetical protein